MRAPTTADSAELVDRYRGVRSLTERLREPLGAEDCQVQSMADASPTKWHLAHTSWFFETFVLTPGIPDYQAFHPAFGVLFNSYYNSVGPQHARPQRGLLTRPPLDDVLAYRAHVDRLVLDLLASGEARAEPLTALVELGLHHEQQHQELLLTDAKHLLSCNPMRPAYRIERAPAPAAAAALRWQRFARRTAEVGHDGRGFAFDNEQPRHAEIVAAFELASRPVTNQEYLAFIDDGGYRRPELWLSDGWSTLSSRGWTAPLYWERDASGAWHEFTLAGMRRLDPGAPVCHVSFYEADAFATWSGARLPSEAEWEVAAAPARVAGNLLDGGAPHPRAAAACASEPLQQLFGDVWEWTRSAYAAYPGYRAPAGALGEYNGKFMCNQLVLRGGSCATPASHIRATYRNFFPPDARWQFSGIRLAKDA